MPHILALIDQLAPEVPRDWQAFVCVGRGLWSPRLWRHLRRLHPLLRIADGVDTQHLDALVGQPFVPGVPPTAPRVRRKKPAAQAEAAVA